jgi:hypothetical protein
MATVRVYQKRQLRLDLLSFKQRQMYELGNVGVAAVKQRVAAAIGPTDAPAKPLSRGYAIWKTKQGRGNRRNLTFTGDMLRSFEVRTVSENRVKATVTGRSSIKTIRNRRGTLVGVPNVVKALANQKIEPWMVFSPRNREAVAKAAQRMLEQMKPRLILERALGGRQR